MKTVFVKVLYLILCVYAMVAMAAGCATGGKTADAKGVAEYDVLKERIDSIIKGKPGRFGVAVIVDSRDTVTVNNTDDYPLMSMFKLHEALGVCHVMDSLGRGLDSVMVISREHLDPQTYSPDA